MNIRYLPIALLATVCIYGFALGGDFRTDPTFVAPVPVNDEVYDLAVQPDGKIVIAGAFQQIGGQPRRYIARLNGDGTNDTTFTSPFSVPSAVPGWVRRIKLLPNGKILVAGVFAVGSQYTEYARLNADGTPDASMVLGTLGEFPNDDIEPLPDGKFLLCGSRNDQDTASLVYRMNADGSRDVTFHANFAVGFCQRVLALPDGKVLMVANSLYVNGIPVKRLARLNSDGSKDATFDPAIPANNSVRELIPLSDGKLFVYFIGTPTGFLTTLNVDGSLDQEVPVRCAGPYLQQPAGWSLISGCKKSSSSANALWHLAAIRPDGSQDPGFDWIGFDSGGIGGIRQGPNGSIYVYGRFLLGTFQTGNHVNVARLVPDTIPRKPRFDFDGDGQTDVSVYRPSDRYWYVYGSTAGPSYMQWGLSTDKLAASQYDSDGKTDIGVFRDGVWYVFSSVSGYQQSIWGAVGDKPFFADFSGLGIESQILRGVRSGNVAWISRFGSPRVLPGEQISDIPVLGDFEGDGRDEIGFFRDGVWYGGISDPVPPWQPTMYWGIAGDIPVPGDYDGDRQTDYAVFRPSTGDWWINRTSDGMIVIHFGLNGDVPVPADYDGDGEVDLAVYRNGAWWQYLSATGTVRVDNWGVAGDIPIPAQHQ